MEIILKSDDESIINEIIALAKNLNVTIVSCDKPQVQDGKKREDLLNQIINFKASGPSSFGEK